MYYSFCCSNTLYFTFYKVIKMNIKDNKKNVVASKSDHVARPHPSVAMAVSLIKWMDKGDTAPSLIINQGLFLSRSIENDGLPFDEPRKHIRNDPKDNQIVIKIMNELRSPGVNRVNVLAEVFKAVWVRKTVFHNKEEKVINKPVRRPVSNVKKRPDSTTTNKTAPNILVKRKKTVE